MYALNLTSFETMAIYGVLVIAVLSLVYAYLLYRNVMAEDKGTEAMIRIWTAIKDGADAYLSSQLKTILPFVAILVFVLFASAWIAPPTPAAVKMYGDNAHIIIAFGRAGAFLLGAAFSLMVGQFGMRMAVQGNIRVASAAMRNFGDALADRLPLRHRDRHVDRRLGPVGRHHDLHHLRRGGARRPVGLRFRRHAAGDVHARGRRHLHQGCRCRRRPGGQSRRRPGRG